MSFAQAEHSTAEKLAASAYDGGPLLQRWLPNVMHHGIVHNQREKSEQGECAAVRAAGGRGACECVGSCAAEVEIAGRGISASSTRQLRLADPRQLVLGGCSLSDRTSKKAPQPTWKDRLVQE